MTYQETVQYLFEATPLFQQKSGLEQNQLKRGESRTICNSDNHNNTCANPKNRHRRDGKRKKAQPKSGA